jgi:hypothetical protein
MSASHLLCSQPDRGRKQWLGTVRYLCLWCACDLQQSACVVVGVRVGCYRVGGDSIDAAAPVARRLTLATSLTAALCSISDSSSSSSSSRVDVVVAPAAAAAAAAAGKEPRVRLPTQSLAHPVAMRCTWQCHALPAQCCNSRIMRNPSRMWLAFMPTDAGAAAAAVLQASLAVAM